MKKIKVDLSVSDDGLVKAYVDAASANGSAIDDGDYRTANRQWDAGVALSAELKRRGPSAQRRLFELLGHENPWMRYWAASDVLSFEVPDDVKLAVTHYRTIATNGAYSLLEITLETGRKNQIRTHLSEQGHPVVGDRMYGSTVNPLGRLGLHAKLLGFDHPATGKRMVFTAPTPKSFRQLVG